KLNLANATANPPQHSLNAKEGYGCVLCQLDNYIVTDERLPRTAISVELFGDFTEASTRLENLYGETWNAGDFGFDLGEYNLASSEEYSLLDELWIEAIEERLAK